MKILFLLISAWLLLALTTRWLRREREWTLNMPLQQPDARHGERLAQDRRSIRRARRLANVFSRPQARDMEAQGAAQWLRDNGFYLRQQALELARELSGRRRERLPAFGRGLRVEQAARAVLGEQALTQEKLVEALNGFQRRGALSTDEIWALPLYLRLALLEEAAAVLQEAEDTDEAHRQAELACRRLLEAAPHHHRTTLEELPALDKPGEHTAFVERLAHLLMEQGEDRRQTLHRLDQLLEQRGCDLEQLVLEEHRRQAQLTARIARTVESLRFLEQQPWRDIFERVSRVEACLMEDDTYRAMDETGRDVYRRQVQTLALRWNLQEAWLCQRALEHAQKEKQQLGWYLLNPEGMVQLAQRLHLRIHRLGEGRRLALWQGTSLLLSLLLTAGAACLLSSGPAAALIFPVVYYWVRRRVERDLTCGEPAGPLPRLELADGIPAEGKTCVVTTALVSTPQRCRDAFAQLEAFHLGNREENTVFVLLADLPQADRASREGDEALLSAGMEAAEALNHRWGEGKFVFLLRSRREHEGRWSGWERKRGALLMLNNLILHGESGDFLKAAAAWAHLRDVRYVLTLDADTQLLPGMLRPLVGTMLHPLNRPRVQNGRVTEGYGLVLPRLLVSVQDTRASVFARGMNGPGGTEPYMTAGYDFYQRFFGRAIFTGKGIYSVEAYDAVLASAIEPGRVLSHDLLEGSLLRAGLASDLTLLDGFPATVHGYFARLHRWIRGDWQLLPFMGRRIPTPDGPRKNPLPALARWQMADNLLRSLKAPLLLAAMVAAAGSLDRLLALLAVFALWEGGASALSQLARGEGWGKPLWEAAARGLRALMLLPMESFMSLDAVARTLLRLKKRRGLLEWTTAADAERGAPATALHACRRWKGSLLMALAILGLTLLQQYLSGSLLALLWLAAPLWAWWVSRPAREPKSEPLSAEAAAQMRLVARRTYHYFERYIHAEHHFLPPDNVQLNPDKGAAPRTSPTNMGLAMFSLAMGYHMGYSSLQTVVEKLEGMLDAMEKLPRWKGHWYNWYDTQTLEPLQPRYVSSVDSGNLLACLWMTRALLTEDAEKPLEGWLDTWQLHCEAMGTDGDALARELRQTQEEAERARKLLSALGEAKTTWGKALAHQLKSRPVPPERLNALCQRLDDAARMDLSALYDKRRQLFLIGLEPDRPLPEKPACYDLMASEARILSLMAIARGEAPAAHWRKLARPAALAGEGVSLWSWSGTMFEYLLPALFFAHEPGTLAGSLTEGVLQSQMAHGEETGLPWGVSESGYYAFDLNLQYQYRAFGVPALGMKSSLAQERVIAPYATLMAFPLAPRAAWENLQRLNRLGALGELGYYEAVDFTPSRLKAGQSYALVESHMVHHQAMGFLALAQTFTDDLARRVFAALPEIRAIRPLLQELCPHREQAIERTQPGEMMPQSVSRRGSVRRFRDSEGFWPPQVQILSNGRYHVLLDASGSGCSRWQQVALNRWRDDGFSEEYGWNFYIRQDSLPASRRLFPMDHHSRHRSTVFEPHRALFETCADRIAARLEVYVDGERDGEVRRLTLHNRGSRTEKITVFTLLELALQDQSGDEAHPAFGNLFVETQAEGQRLIARRRRRSPSESRLCCAMQVQTPPGARFFRETSREAALGRGRSAAHPSLLEREENGMEGGVLDPCFAAGIELSLQPGEQQSLVFTLAAGENAPETAEKLLNRTPDMAWAREQAVMDYLSLTEAQLAFFHRLLPYCVHARPVQKAAAQARLENAQGEEALWPLGLSREHPILVLELEGTAHAQQAAHLIRAHAWLRVHGIRTTLVLLYQQHGDYLQPLRAALEDCLQNSTERAQLGVPGGIYLICREQCSQPQLCALRAAARVILTAGTTMTWQLKPEHDRIVLRPQRLPQPKAGEAMEETLLLDNGYGGFVEKNGDYWIREGVTPAPWSHFLVNEGFGALVTDRGGGYLWRANSQLGKLTPWFNDPVRDPSGELLLLRDVNSGEVFSPMAQSWTEPLARSTRMGAGYMVTTACARSLKMKLTRLVPEGASVLLMCLEAENLTRRSRTLELTHALRWVLGDRFSGSGADLVVRRGCDPRAVTVENPMNPHFRGMAFHALAQGVEEICCDEGLVWGLGAQDAPPAAALEESWEKNFQRDLGGVTALRRRISLAPGGKSRVLLLAGHLESREALGAVMERWGLVDRFDQILTQTRAAWEKRLSALQIHTPEPLLDLFVNRWLPYQVLTSRFLGRTGYYQAGGAWGFRDQLQDCLTLLWSEPALVREHLLRCAAHQFEEGDVQHWWHDPAEGVRTRISDDKLFLPYVTFRYVEHTGDRAVLDEIVPFLSAPPLEKGEQERYAPAQPGASATLLEHCLRAVEHALGLLGEHGLPLMGTGDWNDAMNRVGAQGRGESVWLGFFLADVLEKSCRLAQWAGCPDRTADYSQKRQVLCRALEEYGWDGGWYRRAFYDNGKPLGSRESEACRIDCLSQAWASLSGAVPGNRARQALDAALEQLWDRENGILALLTPPFEQQGERAGYIQGYLPGVRENGGQYTHAAAWMAAALAREGRGEEACELICQLLPASHSDTPEKAAIYRAEPYAVAADIYTHPQHTGRAGWSWYTGSASWLYVAAVEYLLGLKKQGNALVIDPSLPPKWPGFTACLQLEGKTVTLTVENPDSVSRGLSLMEVNGRAVPIGPIPLEPFPESIRVVLG